MEVKVYTGADWAHTLREAWIELQGDSVSATPFQTWAWIETWHRHFKGRPVVLVVQEDDRVHAIFPLVRKSTGWTTLRPMGAGPSDYLHPLMRTGSEEEAWAAIAAWLGEKRASIVDLPQISERVEIQGSSAGPSASQVSGLESKGSGASGSQISDFKSQKAGRQTASTRGGKEATRGAEATGGAASQVSSLRSIGDQDNAQFVNATCLVVNLPDTFEEYLARLSKSLRYDVRKLDKKLFQEGKARIYAPENLADGLDILFEQHKKRWRSKGLPGAFGAKTERFHRDWAKQAEKHDWLRLRVLEYEGKPIGAIYAMTFNGVCYYYQAGFDPEHAAISPGTLLVAHTIREAIEEGVKQFDFCRGDEPYKRRWQPDHVFENHRLILAQGTGGKVGLAYLRRAWAVEEKLRARLEGGSLFSRKPRE